MKTFINSQALLFNNLRMYFIANKNLKSPHQMLKIGHNLEIVQREREKESHSKCHSEQCPLLNNPIEFTKLLYVYLF